MGDVNYCLVEEAAAVVWLANLAAIELHPTLAAKPDLGSPTSVVFDLDPGAPADVLTCARVALLVRDVLERLHLEAWAKTSGSKGLQLYVPAQQRGDVRAFHPLCQGGRPVVGEAPSRPRALLPAAGRAGREGADRLEPERGFENNRIGLLPAGPPQPTVSTPMTWDEVEDALAGGDPARFSFQWPEVLDRARDVKATSWPMSSPANRNFRSCALDGGYGAGPVTTPAL